MRRQGVLQLQQLLAVGLCLLGWAVLAPPPAAAQPLICDGKARLIDMAKPAFPNGPPWTPLNPADDWTCVRPLAGTSKLCGSMATDSCGAVEFRPILQSSGATPGIIPPDNPLQFKLSANVKGYLTSASFRAGNIGTGGARLRGTYAGTSTLNPVTLDFAWVKNGPTNLPDGTVVFASCGDCRMGFGIMDMTVTALPGAGFRTLELSQLYSDTRCEGSGVNNDGLLWDGSMSYTCVVPTCGDTDLDKDGTQAFNGCVPPLYFDANSVNRSPPSVDNCCITGSDSTCGAVVPGVRYTCPEGYEYNEQQNSARPPNTGTCCLRASCSNTKPASAPGTKFTCPYGYEYSTSADNTSPPTIAACCRMATCADILPASKPNTPFSCAVNTVLKPSPSTISPPSQEACCLPKTCGTPEPLNPTQTFTCEPGTEFDPSAVNTSPPSQQACCKPGTCSQPSPVTKPGVQWTCPSDTQYNPAFDNVSPPSNAVCCKPKTCGDLKPVTSPGKARYQCPIGQTLNTNNLNRGPPSDTLCCKPFTPTCSNTNPNIPGQIYDCFPLFYNASAANSLASKDNCCSDSSPNPQGDVDVYVIKTVSPAADASKKVSTPVDVGSDVTFTLEVGVLGDRTTIAYDVVLTDPLPKGLLLKNIKENPDRKACTYTLTTVVCTWPQFAAFDDTTNKPNKVLITIVATTTLAGISKNTATVTTTSNDTDKTNNQDTAETQTRGACCTSDNVCTNTLPGGCKAPSVFDPLNPCDGSQICTKAQPSGACCINTNNVVTCVEEVPRESCKGIWALDKKCSMVDCKAPTGACCEVPKGNCRNNVTRDQCANRHSWMMGRRCGEMNFCMGGCCAKEAGNCTVTTKDKCFDQNRWVLYSKCDDDYCPTKKCIPPWWTCEPTVPDSCCPGYTCQSTYKKCAVGPYVCKPETPVCEPSSCGGKHGSCCSGKGCFWDHFKGRGKCCDYTPSTCGVPGTSCSQDWDCCLGARCVDGTCQIVPKQKCFRKCKSYDCFNERQKDCNCLYAAAASDVKLKGV